MFFSSDATDHEFKEMSHYKDLREVYAHRMAFHGYGYGLYHPVAAEDMVPPCCGFFDRNGDWNLITSLTTDHPAPNQEDAWLPLDYMPKKTRDIGLEWQPKTSLGTSEHVFTGTVDTPDNQPGGAEAKVKYSSNNKFGAVLMTRKPVTLTAYNSEKLFLKWLDDNRKLLYERYGPQLKKYGFWIITRTYACPGAAINAWSDANKATEMSAKAKAAMLGELGEDLEWSDQLSSRDWSHYTAKSDAGVVVFIDGIDMTPFDWRMEGIRQSLPSFRSSSSSTSSPRRRRSMSVSPKPASETLQLPLEKEPLQIEARRASLSPPQPRHNKRASLQLPERPVTWYSDDAGFAGDESTLRDVGLQAPLARSRSVRSVSPSVHSAVSLQKSPSLRRETRSISIGRATP